MISTTKPFGQTNNLEDHADSALRSTQRTAHEAIDALSDKAQDLKDQAAPVLNRVAAKAEELARRGADVMRDRSGALRERAIRGSDATIGYIKDEPVKAILIAAAAGAALMALVALLGRNRD
jgi:ElaB/YqjD/DUF883 family membrane-anchored ribosome-binding protein